jgi:hypothetical protein
MQRPFLPRPAHTRVEIVPRDGARGWPSRRAGCSQPPAAAPPTNSSPAAVAASASPASEEQLERLRSLGYLDTKGLPSSERERGVRVLDRALHRPATRSWSSRAPAPAQLISLDGEIVRSWKDEPCHRWEHAELLPDGDLVVVGARLDEDEAPDPIESGRYVMRLGGTASAYGARRSMRTTTSAHRGRQAHDPGAQTTAVPAIDPDNDIADEQMTLLTQAGKSWRASRSMTFWRRRAPPSSSEGRGREHWSEPNHRSLPLQCHPLGKRARARRAHLRTRGRTGHLQASGRADDHRLAQPQTPWHWGRGTLSGPHEARCSPTATSSCSTTVSPAAGRACWI